LTGRPRINLVLYYGILESHTAWRRRVRAPDGERSSGDYADNALVIAPHGIAPGEVDMAGFNVFDGKANISRLFAVLTNKDNAAGMASMTTTYEPARGQIVVAPKEKMT
jgi:hypothetical protein